MRFSDIFCSDHKKGFTLPEILLAASIIGIIAALVVPSTISRYQRKTYTAASEKYKLQIQEAVDALPVTENVADFAGTSLYIDKLEKITPASEKVTESEKEAVANFLRNNFKTAKVYSINNSDDADYIDDVTSNVQKPNGSGYGAEQDYYACADLKSGAFLCVRPQTKKVDAVWVYIDVNGSDDPNVTGEQNSPNTLGIDIYEYPMPHKDVAPSDAATKSVNPPPEL